jgi:hypothetical protein
MVPTAQPTARQLLKKQRVNCLTSEIPVKMSNLVTSNLYLLVIYLTSNFGFFWHEWTSLKLE